MKVYQKLQHMIPDVLQLKAQGFTVTKIAGVLGVSKQRVSQIAQAAKVNSGKTPEDIMLIAAVTKRLEEIEKAEDPSFDDVPF